jgi:acetyl-CoA carboxylase biotin carboxyl carrier protein
MLGSASLFDPQLMLDLRYVKKIVEMLDESTCDSIEISTEKGLRIKVSKAAGATAGAFHAPAFQQQQPMMVQAAPTGEYRMSPAMGVPVAAPPAPEAAVAAPSAQPQLTDVKSPMVGTFYGAPEPGAKPFITVGSKVTKGQVLCIIEAMKIMNEIESEVSGVVREIGVTDAHPVEYGQVLFRIDPNG